MAKNGDNIIQISNVIPKDASIEIDIPYSTLREGKPEDVGIDSKVFEVINRMIQSEIKFKGIPVGNYLWQKTVL